MRLPPVAGITQDNQAPGEVIVRSANTAQHVSTLRDYLQVVRRRKWVIAQAVVIVPLAALAFSLNQQAEYEGSAQVLLSSGDLANQLTGTATFNNTPADRSAQTQANLARVPAVAARAIGSTHSTLEPKQFLRESTVSAGTNADLLTFTFTSHQPRMAQLLATAYARAYVRYRLAVDTAPLKTALAEVEAQIAKIPPKGALYSKLEDSATQLRTLAALKTANASVVRASEPAIQTAPRTARNVVLGLILGVFLGVGLAFLREALDTRIRSAEAIGEQLHLPLLARLPAPPKKLREVSRLVMLTEPRSTQAEGFRMLRTNVEFASLGKSVRTLMVTSATEQEGKSTTIANLAVAIAKSGRHVVLVDLDLRRPFVDRFFDLQGRPGITQVAIGASPLGSAICRIPLVDADDPIAGLRNGGAHSQSERPAVGVLDVLPSGAIPPDPGEFVGTARLTEILEHLANHADMVLIDAPPLFHVGDALTLSAKVDAVMVVTNIESIRRPMLSELKRQLDTMPTTKLGFVVTGAEAEDADGYGYGYGSYYARPYAQETVGSRS